MVVSKTRKPGEVHPEKGKVRSNLFAACLQQIVDGFTAQYFVNRHPHKLKYDIPTADDRAVSFDILGRLNQNEGGCDVWIEAKGYDIDKNLLRHYRKFVVDAALCHLYLEHMANDQFWFVSSAPFASSIGTALTNPQWIRQTLLDSTQTDSTTFRRAEFDSLESQVRFESLARSVKVLFLTQDLMRATGLKIIAKPGDNIWDMTRDLYGPQLRLPYYHPYVDQVRAANDLANPDLIQVDQALNVPLLYWPPEDDDAEVNPMDSVASKGDVRAGTEN